MSERVVIVDYGSGNLRSVERALMRAAGEAGRRVVVARSDRAEDLAAADRAVLPGVGAFAACRQALRRLPGMWEALQAFAESGRPLLGICVGMQLMAEVGREHGLNEGFGWFRGEVRALEPRLPDVRVPHMGWNRLALTPAGRAHPLFRGFTDAPWVYFVHSYAMDLVEEAPLLATCTHGRTFAAAIGRGRVAGVQFHPEKSQQAGIRILRNFLEWQP
ncbi:MAG: imidazole glycerol phosphate synthase subunit HisH [Rhodothalassiaceae bacterium]|nr:MAG: imidazole glycerol phosphate synthase subunit HisH [Rhodothalassiaceae bacterium]